MSARALLGGLALVVLLLLQGNASAAPVSGSIVAQGAIQLEGDINWTTDAGTIDLRAEDGVPGYSWALEAPAMTVKVVRWSMHHTETVIAESTREPERTESFHEFSAAGIKDLRLERDAQIAIVTSTGETTAQATTASVQPVQEYLVSSDPYRQSRIANYYDPFKPKLEDVVVATAEEIKVAHRGDVRVSFWAASVVVQDDDRQATFQAGEWVESEDVDLGVTRTYVRQMIFIEARDARIEAVWEAPARLAASAPTIALSGTVFAQETTGALQFGGIKLDPAATAVEMLGDLVLAPAVPFRAEPLSVPTADVIVPYDSTGSRIDGAAQVVRVNGAPISAPGPADEAVLKTGAITLSAGALALLAWRYGPLLVAVLYSRLETGALLDNRVRAQIYEIVQANPGISARGVHRKADASWGTVVHHLQKLSEAGYVVAQAHGRAKCYYENHGKWDGYQEPIALLSRAKTRSIAKTILGSPGHDQAGLVTATGFPQSTTSYHLIKLEEAGLVSKERTTSGASYYPTRLLRDVMDRLPHDVLRNGHNLGDLA